MPTLSRDLERTLHRAIGLATERRHVYATLEHLLLAMLDSVDVQSLLAALAADAPSLRERATTHVEGLTSLAVGDGEHAQPTGGFQRAVGRAVRRCFQSRRKGEVEASDVLAAMFAARETGAVVTLLQNAGITKERVLSYLAGNEVQQSPAPAPRKARMIRFWTASYSATRGA